MTEPHKNLHYAFEKIFFKRERKLSGTRKVQEYKYEL